MALGIGLGYAAGGASQGLLDLWKVRLLEQEAEARAQAEQFNQMMQQKEFGLRQQTAGREAEAFTLAKQKAAFDAAEKAASLRQGTPEAEMPYDYRTIGVQTGLAPSLTMPQVPSGQTLATPPGLPNAPTIPVTSGGRIPFNRPEVTDIGSAPMRSIQPITFPEVAGQPSFKMVPQTAEQLQAIKQKEEIDKAMNQFIQVPEGGTAFMPSTGMKLTGAPKKEPFTAESSLVDSKGNPVIFQAATGKFFRQGTGEELPSGEVRRAAPQRDPLAQAIAQERLDAMRKAAEPYDIEPEIRTTSLGNKYLEINSSFSQGERTKMREAAHQQGIAIVTNPALAAKLVDVEIARANQNNIMDDIARFLPKDAGGRLIAAPGITLDKLLQVHDARAAYGAWRTAAIGTLKAMVGGQGSGLRINQAEIILALENDIPELTDTVDVARHKFENIRKQLNNVEYAILNKWPKGVTPPPIWGGPQGDAAGTTGTGVTVPGTEFTVRGGG